MKSRALELAEDMLKRYAGEKAVDVAGACDIVDRHVKSIEQTKGKENGNPVD